MIVDFHTHMFPERIAEDAVRGLSDVCGIHAYTNGTYGGLFNSTKAAGIDLSIALPVVTRPSQYGTIAQFAREHQDGPILSFAGVHPADSNAESALVNLSKMGIKGIKLHPDYQDAYFNDIRYKRIVARASELGLITVVHAGVDAKCPHNVHCTPKMAAEVIDEVRPSRLVLAHMGGNRLWDEVEEYLVGKDVCFDTGIVLDRMPQEQFLRIVKNHGADRILFATDSPWAGQKEYVAIMRDMPLSEEEKEKILGGNAQKLLQLHGPML